MFITLVGATLLTMCQTWTPEQVKAVTDAANAINNAAITDYKVIHEIKHSK